METVNYLKTSTDDQLQWIRESPSDLKIFCNDSELIAVMIERLEKFGITMFDAHASFSENLILLIFGDTLFHELSREPINETKMNILIDLLKKGFGPNLTENNGESFFEVFKLKKSLVKKIQTASDSQVTNLFKTWTQNETGGE